MKTIKCSQVGGDTCDFVVSGETKEEVMQKFGEHAKMVHPEMIAKSTPESMKKWNEDFDKLWEETPES